MKHTVSMLSILAAAATLTGCAKKPSAQSPPDAQQTESGVKMVLLPAGTFTMGEPGEIDAPPHEVTLSAFYIDVHLVTQADYERVMGANPSRWKAPDNPVEQVRWSDAVRYCNKRSELEGLEPCYDIEKWTCDFAADGYRLPTEAEWEYACRAGTQTAWFFGPDASRLGDYAWFQANASGRPQPVGRKKPNPWGLYDMIGNLWQWCNDFYQVDYYEQSPQQDPTGPDTGETKVVRGGAWKFTADACRSAYRYNESPGYTDVCFGYDIYGFRCVRRPNSQDPQ
ncbi:MAG TPA: formylglycine-generating enzyme family protein [Phycisphaerales bacterium]|nr:formylglycine-generating enzyme family protein [Phycisphaerales bacterium]